MSPTRARRAPRKRPRVERSGFDALPAARKRAIRRALDRVDRCIDRNERLAADPIGSVRGRYRERKDLEIAALVGACLAFGNVKALRAKVDEAFDRLGPSLARLADDELEVFARLGGFRHRVYRGEDLARLVIGARRVQRASGSLGLRFQAELRSHGALRPALTAFTTAIREGGGLHVARGRRRGALHILPDPAKTSGCKRLLLFLRWMVRDDDGVDLGLWHDLVPTSLLLCPVDTHIFKLAKNLGLTSKKTMTWATAEEIGRALAFFDPNDPARFDFSLCHLGMLQRCPSRRDAERCKGCGVKSVCRHWDGHRARRAR